MHKKSRKQFAEDKQTKDVDYWNHVLRSDETKINVFGSDVLPALGATINWGNHKCQHVLWHTKAEHDLKQSWAAGQYSNMIMTTALLKMLRLKVMDWPSMSPDLKPNWAFVGHPRTEGGGSARSLISTSSVMSSRRSGKKLQWQPVKLWWTQCSRGLRQCCKIMVATQNIQFKIICIVLFTI